jgi:hypothetical protein
MQHQQYGALQHHGRASPDGPQAARPHPGSRSPTCPQEHRYHVHAQADSDRGSQLGGTAEVAQRQPVPSRHRNEEQTTAPEQHHQAEPGQERGGTKSPVHRREYGRPRQNGRCRPGEQDYEMELLRGENGIGEHASGTRRGLARFISARRRLAPRAGCIRSEGGRNIVPEHDPQRVCTGGADLLYRFP